ncbi:MAG: hypothetical protein OQL06_02010 [Gammaproteobacteria bacterium]|nr:hypothetical protein [Gammaproteobacteria bacterium]
MSLLLDALKKAADEKQKNASPADESEDNIQLEELSEAETEISADDDLDLDLEIEQVEADFPAVDETLEISEPQAVEQSVEDTGQPEMEAPIHSSASDDALQIAEEETKIISADKKNVVDTESNTEDSPPVEQLDETAGGNLSSELPAASAADDMLDVSSDRTHRKASRVENEKALEALINKSNQSTRRNNLKTNIAIIFIVLIVLVFAVGYYVIQVSSSTQKLFIADALDRKEQVNPVNASVRSVKPAAVTPEPVVTATTPVAAAAAISTQPKKQSVQAAARAPVKKPVKKINVIRKSIEDPIDTLLRQAYAAFNNEDYVKSNNLYTRVIDRDAHNRDALLGLAAIGIKQERYEYAKQKYLHLLNLNPKDSHARAGLSTIESKIDPQLNESQLKFMLREQPEAAHLYFALGSLYAAQQKWPKAQSAFFSAWSADNKNADYSYSLAVSLDHLGKKQQAKDYYELSIKLKQINGGNFSVEDTKNRIKFLQDTNS